MLYRRILIPTLLFSFTMIMVFSEVANKDKPQRGEWDFKLQKVWEIDRAGGDVLGRPQGIAVSDDGTLYLSDDANRIDYIFSPDGKIIRTFAKRGEGPGADYREMTRDQIRKSKPLPRIPYVVWMAASRAKAMAPLFSDKAIEKMAKMDSELNGRLAALIPGGRQVIVEGTGHDIHVDKPEVLIALVMEMINTISIQAVVPGLGRFRPARADRPGYRSTQPFLTAPVGRNIVVDEVRMRIHQLPGQAIGRLRPLATALCMLPVLAAAADRPRIVLGGDVGRAAASCSHRFLGDPFNSLPWLRADLTGEKVTEFDDKWDHPMNRPFKNYSGDISGRFIEIMALDSRGDWTVHPALKGMLRAVSDEQRPGGYFCASGVIDWQQPIDFRPEGGMDGWGRMMPALWGNARLLCGLVEATRAFPADTAIAGAARRLGDFYIAVLPRFNNSDRMAEYTAAGSYAAGYVTCWFPAMEGLVKLRNLTGERKYLEAAAAIAEFYRRFDRLPIDHAHGMLCNQVSLLLLFEATKGPDYLARVEKRWEELVQGGYINPAGGILEKCHVRFARDEGCAIVDWLRLNLALGRVTGKARYWAMAERTLHNHFLQNQTAKGGFGHRSMLCDEEGVYGFGEEVEESTWCCSYHGELGFINLRHHLLAGGDGTLTCNFALDFTAKDGAGATTSVLRPGQQAGEVLRQRISLAGQPAAVIRIRRPLWADTVTAVDTAGASVPLAAEDGWCATTRPVSDVEFVYSGGVYAEDRHGARLNDGPRAGEPFVLGYGPKLLAAEGRTVAAPKWPTTLADLEAKGLRPFPVEFRRKDCCFVFGRDE